MFACPRRTKPRNGGREHLDEVVRRRGTAAYGTANAMHQQRNVLALEIVERRPLHAVARMASGRVVPQRLWFYLEDVDHILAGLQERFEPRHPHDASSQQPMSHG